MSKVPVLYRRRIIPEECVLLKDDIVLRSDDNMIVTEWKDIPVTICGAASR
jgi:hypothetical protein